MQLYYFYRHHSENTIFISAEEQIDHTLEFLWVDSLRQELVHHTESWQNDIYKLTGLVLNEFHMQDLLNIEHPCAFDTVEEYDLLIFRKLISPDDQIDASGGISDSHENVFGLTTTPMSFILTPNILVSVREQGNMTVESYIQRIQLIMGRAIAEQNKPRKLPSTPADLSLRLLNSMIDGYLNLRSPLTRRVEYWQQQLLQGNRRFKQWHQLFHEDMAFQQIENLCEEQIETLQEFRDELVDNYHHIVAEQKHKTQDILLVRLNDLMSHIERVQKHTLRLRNAIQSAIDLHFSAIANQTNENMRILAIITAIFAPLTLLTGVYGMNFEFIPGLKSPIGFWIMLGVMLMSTILLLYYFYQQHLVGRGERSVIDLLAQQHKQRNVNILWFLDYEPIKQTLKEVEKMTKLK
ncbi:magnesium transporter CorA family protein [Acinetobacter sp. NIPH 2699]|uniref:magnesium transporter CorA family protein n=1 Tax=Acinetobacter sp. NIPH 2699 TaxID=2923433 RepID=UPI001F4B3BEB|nr:magnesium transporter CorA family protein [Acinetobacter sp. NIPH 2699]MCH7335478.1 magnesium transporter CorA family protein [Acinetobacter sp. NIPH 2699]